MKKIKIVHLVNDLTLGGTSKVVLDLCKLTDRSKYSIYVVSLSNSNPLVLTPEWPKDVAVYSFDYFFDGDYSLRRYITLSFNLKITFRRGREVIECLEKLNPDILHCHLQPRELLITKALKLKFCKFVYTDHLVRLKEGQYTRLNSSLLSYLYKRIYSAFHVVAVAKSVLKCHKDYQLFSKKKLHVLIENKIDTEKFSPKQIPKVALRVIYVARLEKRKGQEVLLKAWSRLKENANIELILIGPGDAIEEEKLHVLNGNLNPHHPVIFTGGITNVLEYMQSADIAVFPSFHEGLPLSILEKMSCGLPVIASNIEEFNGIIDHGKNGLFFNVGDETDLYNKIQLLINDPELRKKLGENARKFVVNNYDIHTLKDEYEKLYGEIFQ